MSVFLTHEIREQIKRIDIKQYLSDTRNIDFRGGTNCCCMHPDHDDANPSFSVWTDKNGYSTWCCFGCNPGAHDIISLVQWLSDYKGSPHKLTFHEAVESICKYAGIELPKTSGYSYENKKITQNNSLAKAFNFNLLKHPEFEAHKYLNSRGLDEKDIADWCIGYNGCTERITFPLFNRNSNVIAFSNRIVGKIEGTAKYINSPNSDIFQKSEYLYGINRFDASLDYCYITEGQLDVIGAAKFGLKNVLAPLGKALTEKHLEVLENFTNLKNIIILFDADEAGQNAVPKAAELIRKHGFSASYVSLPYSMDLFDFAMQEKENLVAAIKNRTSYYFYRQLEDYSKEYDRVMFSLQSRVLEASNKIEAAMTNANEKQMLHAYLRSKFNLILGGKTDARMVKEYIDQTEAV